MSKRTQTQKSMWAVSGDVDSMVYWLASIEYVCKLVQLGHRVYVLTSAYTNGSIRFRGSRRLARYAIVQFPRRFFFSFPT